MYFQDMNQAAGVQPMNHAQMWAIPGIGTAATPGFAGGYGATTQGQSRLVPVANNMRTGYGRNHWGKRKRPRPAPGFPKTCEICNVTLDRQYAFDSHNNGKRHLKNLRKKELADELKKEREEKDSKKGSTSKTAEEKYLSISPLTANKMCTLCNVEFTSSIIEQSHMKGRRHIQNVRNSLRGGRIVKSQKKAVVDLGMCAVCDVRYTSTVMKKTHLAGKKHAKTCKNKGVPLIPPGEEPTIIGPPTKKQKIISWTPPRSAPRPVWGESEPYKILETQAEEAYENYARIAVTNPSEGQAMYMKYQALYKAYEVAYKEFTDKQGAPTI